MLLLYYYSLFFKKIIDERWPKYYLFYKVGTGIGIDNKKKYNINIIINEQKVTYQHETVHFEIFKNWLVLK